MPKFNVTYALDIEDETCTADDVAELTFLNVEALDDKFGVVDDYCLRVEED